MNFNTMGAQGRDCPRCFRVGTLAGGREGDHPRLTCTGCRTQFELTWSNQPGIADTLTVIPVADPPRRREFLLTPPRPRS